MNRFWKAAPWIVRAVLIAPTMIFAMIAFRYLAHPVASAAAQGMILPAGLGITIARVGFGGFPLGCALFLASCQVSRRLLVGLAFVEIMLATVLFVRIFGMLADSTVHENLKLVGIEIVLLAVTTMALLIEIGRRSRQDRGQADHQSALPARPAHAA